MKTYIGVSATVLIAMGLVGCGSSKNQTGSTSEAGQASSNDGSDGAAAFNSSK